MPFEIMDQRGLSASSDFFDDNGFQVCIYSPLIHDIFYGRRLGLSFLTVQGFGLVLSKCY